MAALNERKVAVVGCGFVSSASGCFSIFSDL